MFVWPQSLMTPIKVSLNQDVKSPMEDNQNRFEGNKESKKMQRLLRNKPDLDELSMDDLYNNLKVYKAEIKIQSSSNSNSRNVAFVSSENTSSTNETVNTALYVSTVSTQDTLLPQPMSMKSCSSSSSSLDIEVKDISIKNIKNQLEEALKEKDDLKLKLEIFEESSKNLTKLINSQICVKDKIRLGKKIVRDINEVPPPTLGSSNLQRADLSIAGIVPGKPKTARLSAHIIEDWESDSEDKMCLHLQKEVRQIWNNAMRVNLQNFSKRDFAPIAVLTKSGIVPVSAARPINTATPNPFMNVARTRPNSFHKSHSTSRTPFNQLTALKNRNLNDRVNTAKVNSVNTAKHAGFRDQNKMLLTISLKTMDHTCLKDLIMLIHKADSRIFDSGCSRHMTGNKFYLSNYQDIDGGSVAFRGSSKGGNQTNGNARTKENIDAGQAEMNTNSKYEVADDARKKNRVEDPAKEDDINGPGEATNTNSTNRLNTVSSPVNVISSMGELTFFLGLQVQQKKDGIFISQDKYVVDILKKFDFITVKTTSTPTETNKALIKDEEA
ncbi:hypothetical protein Tco_0188950 [Tanacetum coccineum]